MRRTRSRLSTGSRRRGRPGIAGLLLSVLFVVSLLLIRERPAPGSTAREIAHFYLKGERGRVALVGLYLVPFAGIAFLWFVAAIRSHLGAREDRFYATVLCLFSEHITVATIVASGDGLGRARPTRATGR